MTLVNYVLADEILGRFFFLLFQVFVDLFNNIKNWFCFFQEIVPGRRHASRGFAGKNTIGRYIRLGPVLSIMWPCIQEKLAYAR